MIIRIVILVFIPLIFSWLMFDPFATFDLKPHINEVQNIPAVEINDNLTRFILADFFQTTLNLNWYQVCFENKGVLNINGRTVMNRKDRGDVQVRVAHGGYSPIIENYKILTARPFEDPDCKRFNISSMGLSIGTSTIFLGVPANNTPEDIVKVAENEYLFSFTFDFSNIHLYIRQDWIAFLVKYLIITIAWGSLILLWLNLFGWIKNK